MDDNRITAYTFTRMQPQATDTDLLTAQREMDAYCKDISRVGRNTAVAAGIVKAFADEGIDIEITTDGSRPTKQFAPDADPFIQGM